MLVKVHKFLKDESGVITLDYLVLTAGTIGLVIGVTVVFSNAIRATADEIHDGLHNTGMPYVFHSEEDIPEGNGEFVESEENGIITNRYNRI